MGTVYARDYAEINIATLKCVIYLLESDNTSSYTTEISDLRDGKMFWDENKEIVFRAKEYYSSTATTGYDVKFHSASYGSAQFDDIEGTTDNQFSTSQSWKYPVITIKAFS